MRTKAQILSELTNPGVVAVVRAPKSEMVMPLSQALLAGGVHAIEITMTTPNALAAIREASAKFGSRALIGVGTVTDADTCRAALASGAEFVVSPICQSELPAICRAAGKPCLLGAVTPTEAQRVHELGADFVKLFPADNLGPGYVKALRAPLPHLQIVPTGGVDLDTIADFFKAGCSAVGVGGALVSMKLLQAGDWASLTRLASQFVEAATKAKAAL
jgi:2-dehydro-3-deoxyphosphogluconate aldolase/(4S)-4-hydroxy-2-oxoglutarate aldolase